jgi:hypothetical protein
VGDILYINTCPPYAEQESEELGDEVIARLEHGVTWDETAGRGTRTYCLRW